MKKHDAVQLIRETYEEAIQYGIERGMNREGIRLKWQEFLDVLSTLDVPRSEIPPVPSASNYLGCS